MRIVSNQKVTEIIITVTPDDARRIMEDFNQTQVPSAPGKVLYAALAAIVTADDNA